jgi:hypothetical protein
VMGRLEDSGRWYCTTYLSERQKLSHHDRSLSSSPPCFVCNLVHWHCPRLGYVPFIGQYVHAGVLTGRYQVCFILCGLCPSSLGANLFRECRELVRPAHHIQNIVSHLTWVVSEWKSRVEAVDRVGRSQGGYASGMP